VDKTVCPCAALFRLKGLHFLMKSWISCDILRILQADGWIIKHQAGFHVQLVHPVKSGKVTVPHPEKDLAEGTVRNIIRQVGLNPEDLK
jgi:predicted RNA binding protein YcfA (HicA-like mRNA interferase family)